MSQVKIQKDSQRKILTHIMTWAKIWISLEYIHVIDPACSLLVPVAYTKYIICEGLVVVVASLFLSLFVLLHVSEPIFYWKLHQYCT